MGWFYKRLCPFNSEDEDSDWQPAGKHITAMFFKGQVAPFKGLYLDFTTPLRKVRETKMGDEGRQEENGEKRADRGRDSPQVLLPRSQPKVGKISVVPKQWERFFSSLLSSHNSLTAWTTISVEPFRNTAYRLLSTTETCYVVRFLSRILSWLDQVLYLKLF